MKKLKTANGQLYRTNRNEVASRSDRTRAGVCRMQISQMKNKGFRMQADGGNGFVQFSNLKERKVHPLHARPPLRAAGMTRTVIAFWEPSAKQ